MFYKILVKILNRHFNKLFSKKRYEINERKRSSSSSSLRSDDNNKKRWRGVAKRKEGDRRWVRQGRKEMGGSERQGRTEG